MSAFPSTSETKSNMKQVLRGRCDTKMKGVLATEQSCNDVDRQSSVQANVFHECVLGVRANVFMTNELKGKGYHKEQSSLSTKGGHSVLAVVNVHLVNSDR